MSVLIVGASVAGIATARALRDYGYRGAVTVLEAEHRQPYDKPPLSKQMLLGHSAEPIPLLAPDELTALGVDLRLGVAATGLDTDRKVVRTDQGDVEYEKLVIATGARPRTLPGTDGLAGVHTLRCADDAAMLHAALPTARHLVVVGGGFIGSEVASAAVECGCAVTIVEVQDTPLAHALGPEIGAELTDLHRHHGVAVYAGGRVAGFTGDGHVQGVRLADGRHLPADLVVIGVGAVPATEWLRESGPRVDNGVVCDKDLRLPGYPDIWAVGDVAVRQHPLYSEPLRIEHWTNAGELGRVAAASIVGAPAPKPQLPYVWTDLYGRRIQIVGRPAIGRLATRSSTMLDGKLVAVYAADTGIAVGAVVVDDPRTLLRCRRAILGREPAAHIALSAPTGTGIALSEN